MNHDETFRIVLLEEKQGTRLSGRDQTKIEKFAYGSQTRNLSGYQNGILPIPGPSDSSKKNQRGKKNKSTRKEHK